MNVFSTAKRSKGLKSILIFGAAAGMVLSVSCAPAPAVDVDAAAEDPDPT